MAERSSIEWTDATWNPIVGCSLESPGCTNCYAMRMAGRLERMGQEVYRGLTKPTKAGGSVWTGTVRRASNAQLTAPLRWRRPRRVFVNSMSDLFHPDALEDWIADTFNIMADAHWHIYQILTKRSGRMRRVMGGPKRHDLWDARLWHRSVLPNVWLGVSVEDADRMGRIADLAATPAALRFISFEPLLGPLGRIPLDGIGWVIVGEESGPRARPMQDDWVRPIRDQCAAAGVPFLFKQRVLKGRKTSLPELDGRRHTSIPDFPWPLPLASSGPVTVHRSVRQKLLSRQD